MHSPRLQDRDALVTFREYQTEMAAALDQAILAAQDVQAGIQSDSGDGPRRYFLVVRRDTLHRVRQVLDGSDSERPGRNAS